MYLQQGDDSDEEHDEENEKGQNVAAVDEDEVPNRNDVTILNLLESMHLQLEENSSLVNERLATLSNFVRVHSEQFTAYSTTQDQGYNTLNGMIESQANNFTNFTNNFMQHFPLNQPLNPPPQGENESDES